MEGKEVESDGEEFHIPPPEFERKAVTSFKSAKESVVPLTDHFNESKLSVDEASIECIEFLNDGTYLAIGCGSGITKIVSTAQGNTQFILKGADHSPVTGIAMNPNKSQVKHALLLTHSEGTVEYWHSTSRQLLFVKKYEQMLQCCEISPLGSHYAFAGDAGKIRIGLLNKGDPSEVQEGHFGCHDNRIFCLKWNPNDNNILASGGWDRAVHFWDIRLRTSVKQLFGCYIGGEAIDFRGNDILLGSNKPQNSLRIYDSKADKIRTLKWDITEESQAHYTTGVLSCFFAGKDEIVACTPKNEVRLFTGDKCVSEYKNREEDLRLYCMQHFAGERRVATGWNDGCIRWLNY